jgi:hypothetical protein
MKKLVFVFILLFGASAFSQDQKKFDFVLDPSKPYVYLKFDHIGPVKPNSEREVESYLWLKVVNNCRIPILFRASGPPPGYPGVSLEDEVVEEEHGIQIISDLDIEKFQIDQELRKERLKHKPQGYSFEVSGVARVQPGQELLFSVPLNHVDDDWYFRIHFTLDLNHSSLVTGPFTYLPFYKWNLPKDEKLINTIPAKPIKQ